MYVLFYISCKNNSRYLLHIQSVTMHLQLIFYSIMWIIILERFAIKITSYKGCFGFKFVLNTSQILSPSFGQPDYTSDVLVRVCLWVCMRVHMFACACVCVCEKLYNTFISDLACMYVRTYKHTHVSTYVGLLACHTNRCGWNYNSSCWTHTSSNSFLKE